MPKNGLLGISGLVLLATSILFLFFIILPGVTDSTPFGKTYFLRADTSGITGARAVSQWTYFYICGDGNKDCGGAHAAIPFGYAWDGRAQNAPDSLIGSYGGHTTSKEYYYLWRFGWVFILITLFFEVLAFFASFVACCGRLGAAVAFLISSFALFCFSIAAALTTVTFVKARDQFRDNDRSAKVGVWSFGFLWGGYAALLISVILFALGMRKDRGVGVGRSYSTRSRSLDGRRVKDEYS
ncbi:SUR7 family protein FMP45 [Cladobotryum mycophilum]|uniref:SUR7 family protein FMP45 n=1 Tax=Cladobotryum mycophilum TaxID=491253 RepID=A0ABR0SFY0_9HYPO